MKLRTFSILTMSLAFILAGCGNDPVSTNEPPKDSLKDYIDDVSPYPSPTPEFDVSVGKLSDTTAHSPSGVMICSVEEFEMGRNMHEIVAFEPNAVALWPGCIVQGKDVGDGILNPVSVGRTPITIGIPGFPGLPVEQLSKTIENPNQFNVAGALNQIVDDFIASDNPLPAVFSFDSKETYDFEQGMLDLGISADWVGGNLRSRFEYEWESTTNTLLLKFTQKYYTATVDPPSSSDSYFNSSVTVGDLKNYTGDGNPLCYVKSVTYGRIGILSITSSSSQSEMKASVDAAFDAIMASGEIDSEASYAQVLRESEMKLLILGGSATDGIVSLTNPIEGLMNWINAGIELNQTTRGVPISYVVAHLRDNTNARFQYTTSFKQRICTWADQPAWVSVYAMTCHGGEGGFYPALEGWCYVWLTTEIPGMDPIVKYKKVAFGNFDPGETRTITSASWDNPIPKQAGTKFTLRIKIVEDDDSYDDNMGDYSWEFTYPTYSTGTGDCSEEPLHCLYSQLFVDGGQKIIAYFKVHLDGPPEP